MRNLNYKNLNITGKLTISACIFLLPLGIMLFSIISVSFTSINKDKKEIYGIEVLNPAIALMQNIPLYVRMYADGSPGDIEYTRKRTDDLLTVLNEKYTQHFSVDGYIVSPQSLIENWEHLKRTTIRDTVLWAYRQLMQDLYKIIIYTGDISGLVTDSSIESAYLIAATVHELPQAQDRMVIIGNILRSIEDGAFTQRRREELNLNLDLLIYSDNARIQNRFSTAGALNLSNANTLIDFELLLKTCYERLSYFAAAVGDVTGESVINIQRLSVLFENSNLANDAIYRLQEASLQRLESLINERINSHILRLTLSLAAVFLSIIIAFYITIYIILGIRKSTINMSGIFKRLDENDLTVKIEADSNDELGDFMKALKGFLKKLQGAFSLFNANTSMVSTAVLELSSSARQVTDTANEQSASVAEIVSTMENNKNLSAQACEKTTEVADLAAQTQELSKRGANLRDMNENMMLQIRNQNAKIIEIIRNLADMLSRIDESIKLIDTIADHTKLIAFNAALEASSSGEAGTRFSVVAGEIRRFADNVVESASEIKERINELQEASLTLLTEANSGTQTIDTSYKRMVEQKEVFENIVEVSQNVAIRSRQISSLSKQQELSLTQVFSALKEIKTGVNHFVSSTGMTSKTVEKLNVMSTELKRMLEIYHITDSSSQENPRAEDAAAPEVSDRTDK